jgi:long-chain acyl-CoA synthetase
MLPELNGLPLNVDPNQTAIIFKNESMTYGQLDQYVQGIANTLVYDGYTGGYKIAIVAKNSLNSFALYLACRRTNNVAVMINWKLPKTVQEKMLADCDVSIVYRDEHLEKLILIDGPINYTSDPSAAALFLFTSGSSGSPKAVIITNGNRQATVKRLHTLPPPNIKILPTPFYHINALNVAEHTLATNGTIIILPEFNSTEYINLLVAYKITKISLVPSMMAMLLKDPSITEHDFSFVRGIIMATSPVSEKLYQDVKQVFYNAYISIGYGLTEFGPVFGPPPKGLAQPAMSCGYPQPEIECKLVDGVLHLKGASMSQGYYNSNSSRIVDGWLNTGDIFRVDENGFYFFVGRADDMYKVGGEQVYPTEIEQALERIDGIAEACVIMLEDDVKGYKPYAFCTGTFEQDKVKSELLKQLPRFKIPRQIWKLAEMPLMGVGKVDRKLLTNKAREMI